MNRIILIGNGFDLAHGLNTGYIHFLSNRWKGVAQKITEYMFSGFEDEFVKFERIGGPASFYDAYSATSYGVAPNFTNEKGYKYNDAFGQGIIPEFCKALAEVDSYSDLKELIEEVNGLSDLQFNLSFTNSFFGHLSNTLALKSWLDIENEYYSLLKSYLKVEDRYERVKKLNKEFGQVKEQLERYLTEICEKELPLIEPNKELREALFFENGIERKSVALSKQATYADAVPEQKKKLLEMIHGLVQNENEQSEHRKIQAMLTRTPYARNPLYDMPGEELERVAEQCIEQAGVYPERILSLNFNYTPTFEKLYAPGIAILEIVNIHGELNNHANPIIFGYGDELDDDYKEIEKTNDNELLDNIKHVHYQNTDNYRRFLEFLQLGPYQVFVLGHSCGNSDRTLLNTIFEHTNCTSIKPFYYQWKDEESQEVKDNYTDIYKNISRNFNNKQNLRDVVANKTYCKPHPQITEPI